MHRICRYRERIGVVIAGLAFAACGGSSGNVFEPVEYPSERVHASTASVSITDVRAYVEPQRSFDTPTVSMPGQGQAKEIALAPESRAWLQNRMLRVLGRGDLQLQIQVKVIEGKAGWNANAFSEEAFASVVLEVTVVDPRDQVALAAATGRASAKISSMDTNDHEATVLFDRAFVRAFEEAITQPSFAGIINKALAQKQAVAQQSPAPREASR